MISHEEAIYALRTKALTLAVADTLPLWRIGSWAELGSRQTMSASGSTYTRPLHSFTDDGIRVGMEVTPSGFSDNTRAIVTAVTDTTVTVDRTLPTDTVAQGRRLLVGLPSTRVWLNSEPVDADGAPASITRGVPYFEEYYNPGEMTAGVGSTAEIQALPFYRASVYVPGSVGVGAPLQYADAMLSLFAPTTPFSMSATSSNMTVRGDVAPFAGQLTQASPGWAVVPITVPLRLRTANSI